VLEFLAALIKCSPSWRTTTAKKLRALGYGGPQSGPGDEEIDKLVAERNAAKKKTRFRHGRPHPQRTGRSWYNH